MHMFSDGHDTPSMLGWMAFPLDRCCTDHCLPFQRPGFPPTEVQARVEVHDTALFPKSPGGVRWAAQLLPFQRSVKSFADLEPGP